MFLYMTRKPIWIIMLILSLVAIGCGGEEAETNAETETDAEPSCAYNEHVQSGQCVACPPGLANSAGDKPSGPNTACQSDPCSEVLGVLCDDFVQAYIKSSNSEESDRFGNAIALSGNTLAVGTTHENSIATGINGNQTDNSAITSGAVYVFTRTNHVWSQQAYIKASNAEAEDLFGHSVALDGDILAVGATREGSSATGINGDQTNNDALYSGAVYVFKRTNNNWSQQAYIKASNAEAFDSFGFSVALSSNTLAVSTINESSSATGVNGDQANNSARESGAVYVFTRTNDTWSQQAYIKASNTESADSFGHEIDLSGDTLAVNARFEDSSATGINGDQANNDAPESGAIYIFTRTNNVWSQEAYIKASNTETYDGFGLSLALSGDTLAAGCGGEDSIATDIDGNQADNNAQNSGAAYVFTRTNNAWSQQAYIKAPNAQEGDLFGHSVAIDGDTLAIGAIGESSNALNLNGDQTDNSIANSGAVYVFTRANDTWSRLAYIKASANKSSGEFGSSVALSGDTLAIGAIHESSSATGINGDQENYDAFQSGAVYVRKIAP